MRIHYPAVIVSAVAYWLLGALWYGVLFGGPWMALEHITMQQAAGVNLPVAYSITFALNLLIAFVLAHLCSWRNAATAARGSAVGVLLWVGIVGPMMLTTYTFELRPLELYAINGIYPLAGLILMGAILGAWTKKAAA